jgi:hypothetical protein
MIPYAQLAAALEAYAARVHGRAPAGGPRPAAYAPTPQFEAPPAVDAPLDEPPQTAAAGGVMYGEGENDHTQVGMMPGAAADPSQEIELGDVIAEEPPDA